MRQTLLNSSRSFVDSFISSSATKFSIFRTVPSGAPSPSSVPTSTLLILDSSFNPPSLAHQTLATSALRASYSLHTGPRRLLLLFSVHNADKKAAPAPFEQRLAMMVKFAEDLHEKMVDIEAHTGQGDPRIFEDLVIDVGLTKLPYYNDKSVAIEENKDYAGDPMHIHLTGFDTYTRIFTAKYYPDHHPPLSALDSFFEKHGLRVTIRTDSKQGSDERGEWGTAAEQRATIKKLQNGELEDVGGKPAWAKNIEIDDGDEAGRGVSSTKVRAAVKEADWATVSKLCTPRVAAWVREEELYTKDD